MRAKLDDETKRLNMIAPAAWFELVEDWRRRQPSPMPSVSEAIRRMVEIAAGKPKRRPKHQRDSRSAAA
jgi:hypothetical protein